MYVRRNRGAPDAAVVPYEPRTPAEKRAVSELAKTYTDYHWGAKPNKIFKVNDPLIPNVTSMGRLISFDTETEGEITFPKGCWLAWNPKHPRHRLYVILSAKMREKFRNVMKHAPHTEPIQKIAERAGGEQARYKLPNVKGYDVGPIVSVTYEVEKKGDGFSAYIHEFGGDGYSGYVPHFAIDVSGRPWICGGSYDTKEPGVTG